MSHAHRWEPTGEQESTYVDFVHKRTQGWRTRCLIICLRMRCTICEARGLRQPPSSDVYTCAEMA